MPPLVDFLTDLLAFTLYPIVTTDTNIHREWVAGSFPFQTAVAETHTCRSMKRGKFPTFVGRNQVNFQNVSWFAWERRDSGTECFLRKNDNC